MTLRTPTQEMHLERIRVARKAQLDARRFLEAEIRAALKERLRSYDAAVDHEVRLGFEAGISKLAIRTEGLGTKDAKTLDDMLERTAGMAKELAGKLADDALSGRYSMNEPEQITVTMTEAELVGQLALLDFPLTPAQTIANGLHRATFDVVSRSDKSRYLSAVSPDWLEEYQNAHPVVTWMSAPDREAEALEWWASHAGA